MRRIRRIAASAMGGFKINGPPKMGKGPMNQGKDPKPSNETSPPNPTQAGRIETCTELVSKAMRCLENNDKDCVTRLIEELVKANCHNGYVVGKEVTDGVRGVVHELWLVSDNECRCELLMKLRDLSVSKKWVSDALDMNTRDLNKWLTKCGIDWKGKTMRNDVVKVIEGLLRERFGWSETEMCEEMFRFIGIDVNDFRKYGIEPCIWLKGLEKLSNLRNPYWLGLRVSDMIIDDANKRKGIITLKLNTTNSIDAIFFMTVLSAIKRPNIIIRRKKGAPTAKYVSAPIEIMYYVNLHIDEWPWPEDVKIIENLDGKRLAKFIAGTIDGDGLVSYHKGSTFIEISNRDYELLYILRNEILNKFNIHSYTRPNRTINALAFYGENAIELLRLIAPYLHHPLKRLRAELILALHDGRITREEFEELFRITKYAHKGPDIKRNNGLEALAQAAPQTHTHGVNNY